MGERIKGKIRDFDQERDRGFVQPEDGSPEMIVFLDDFRDGEEGSQASPGTTVEFEVEHGPEGPRAVDVTVLKSTPDNDRERGRVKWFSHEKRYGFIRRGNGQPDVFVHMNDFRDVMDAYWLAPGNLVEFTVEQAPKGPRAVDVVVIES
jgi:CspA family cold shock protein